MKRCVVLVTRGGKTEMATPGLVPYGDARSVFLSFPSPLPGDGSIEEVAMCEPSKVSRRRPQAAEPAEDEPTLVTPTDSVVYKKKPSR